MRAPFEMEEETALGAASLQRGANVGISPRARGEDVAFFLLALT